MTVDFKSAIWYNNIVTKKAAGTFIPDLNKRVHIMEESTIRLLEAVENAIDPVTEDAYLARWDDFIAGRTNDGIFSPSRVKKADTDYQFRNIGINDALRDNELMLVSQMEGVLRMLMKGRGVLNVRSNYGTGIVTSLFGAPLFVMPEELNTLPTTRPVGIGAIPRLLDAGIPSFDKGFGGDALRMGIYYREVFSHYPKIDRYVKVYHPDTQGPLDLCELLIGSELFYLPYDDPDGLDALLSLMTETMTAYLNEWYGIFPKTPERSSHWGRFCHRGCLVLRLDSGMNVSPETYRSFVLRYDTEILNRFDGGIIHFCGRGDHYIDVITDIPGLYGINMSQPELNDMEKIYRCTVDRGIPIYGFNAKRASADILSRPNGLNCRVTT